MKRLYIDKLFRGSKIHRFEETKWPPRYVVCNTPVGWRKRCFRRHYG